MSHDTYALIGLLMIVLDLLAIAVVLLNRDRLKPGWGFALWLGATGFGLTAMVLDWWTMAIS